MFCFSLHCSLFIAQRNASSSVIARRFFGCLCNIVASALGLCSCERRFLWPLFAPFFGAMSHACSRKPQSTAAADVTLIILGAVLMEQFLVITTTRAVGAWCDSLVTVSCHHAQTLACTCRVYLRCQTGLTLTPWSRRHADVT